MVKVGGIANSVSTTFLCTTVVLTFCHESQYSGGLSIGCWAPPPVFSFRKSGAGP